MSGIISKHQHFRALTNSKDKSVHVCAHLCVYAHIYIYILKYIHNK